MCVGTIFVTAAIEVDGSHSPVEIRVDQRQIICLILSRHFLEEVLESGADTVRAIEDCLEAIFSRAEDRRWRQCHAIKCLFLRDRVMDDLLQSCVVCQCDTYTVLYVVRALEIRSLRNQKTWENIRRLSDHSVAQKSGTFHRGV